MRDKVFLAALGFDIVFLATGCLELGFCLVARNIMVKPPKDGEEAVRNLVFQSFFPLLAGIVNAGFIIAASAMTAVALMSPNRLLLKASGYAVAVCAVFSLGIGLALWISTLTAKAAFFPIYLAQDAKVQDLIQTTFICCGYFNHTSPAFITDDTCSSPAAAALLLGCSAFVASFANILIDNIFTVVFGMVGFDCFVMLAIACLNKDRKERERYRHIDEKSGFRQF